MPEVSITLPSLRQDAVLQRIKEFAMSNSDVDYEIIVVSPFAVNEDRVIHVHEKESLGNVFAHNIASKSASSEYLCYWSDDIIPTLDCLNHMLKFARSKKAPFIGGFRLRKQGREKAQWIVYDRLYAPLGCVSRKTLDLIGEYFAPVYRAYWADPDMCLRVWEAGGNVGICPDAIVEDANVVDELVVESKGKFWDMDTTTFFGRWHDKLGNGMAKDWRIVNKPIYIPPTYFSLARFIPMVSYLRLYGAIGKVHKVLSRG